MVFYYFLSSRVHYESLTRNVRAELTSYRPKTVKKVPCEMVYYALTSVPYCDCRWRLVLATPPESVSHKKILHQGHP